MGFLRVESRLCLCTLIGRRLNFIPAMPLKSELFDKIDKFEKKDTFGDENVIT